MRASRFWPTTAFLVALSLHAGAQQVDDATRSAARQLATDASVAYEAEDYLQAYDRFNRAYQLVRLPTVGIWAARSLSKLGRFVEASERYLEVTRVPLPEGAPPEHLKAQQDAAAERAQLLPRIPNVRVLLAGAEAAEVFVSLNDQVLPTALLGVNRPVDPGTLRVKGVRGQQLVEANVVVAEGVTQDVTLTFPKLSHVTPSAAAVAAEATVNSLPPVLSPASPDRTLAYVAFGVGGAALITGGVFGGLALGQQSDLERACPAQQCGPAQHSANDSYETKKLISGVGVIAGAALVGAGLVLYFTAPAAEAEPQPELAAFCDARQVGLRGAF